MTTSIGWTWVPDGKGETKTGETWNPQVGCLSVSPACHNCYAAGQAHRSSGDKPMVKQHHGLTKQAKDKDGKQLLDAEGRKLPPHWNGQVNRVPHLLAQPLHWRDPRGVFVCSMSDLFFDVGSEDACRWIAAIFGIMAACPQHTFMVLTKRPVNAAKWFAWVDAQAKGMEDEAAPTRVCMGMAVDALAGDLATPAVRDRIRLAMRHDDLAWPLPGVWVGVTAEDQKHADLRVPVLLELPAAVRFVSYEPACGPVDWTRIKWPGRESTVDVLRGGSWDLDPAFGFIQHSDMATLDWLIAGGESGPGARPMNPDWARSARDQCEAAGVAYYFKQVGAWSFDGSNVGAKLAGRELDGRTWDGFPE